MRRWMQGMVGLVGAAALGPLAGAPVPAQRPAAARAATAPAPMAARGEAYVDAAGVMRWRGTGAEVALFGANYTLPSASDYRAAGSLGLDRKRLVDADFAAFARLGWDGVRLALWGDWENSDAEGHLIPNDHLDLFDYALARARERGVAVLLTPIQTYEATWPDALGDTTSPGFSRRYRKNTLGTDPAAIRAQATFLRELLEHVNPYTGTKVKDEPAVAFVEMINEPAHHPEDVAGSVRYIDALVEAVRSTGCTKVTFHNVSQDFRIAEAVRRSRVQGATFGWYPTGLNSGHELRGNYLRTVDDYAPMRDPRLAGRPRLVYEFDSADLLTATMYPAMARAFRAGGAQFAAMFAYDMLGTASRNLGWQTHYLSLVYTPKKAISAVLAAEVMRRLPRGRSYGAYPANLRFGDFRLDPDRDAAELVAEDAFIHAGSTASRPPNMAALRRVAGYGSSPVVTYAGEGAYFLDRVRAGVWRLEVYPDAVPVRDPFEMPRRDKVVTRAIAAARPMTVALPDLGPSFAVQQLAGPGGDAGAARAAGGRVEVRPGVYVLSAGGPVARASLPATVGRVGLAEYHGPPADTVPLTVAVLTGGEAVAGQPLRVEARVVDTAPADSVTLWVRPAGAGGFRAFPMAPARAYTYAAAVPPNTLGAGVYEYAVSVGRRGRATTFPEGVPRRPDDWDFSGQQFYALTVAGPTTPLPLLAPAADAGRLAFTRPNDGWRGGLFRVVPSGASGAPALRVEVPAAAGRLEDYTVSTVVGDRVAGRGDAAGARRLVVRARGLAAGQPLHVTLVERDGTSWGATVALDSAWREHAIPLAELRPVRGVMLPQGFPGEWNYWIAPAAGRGGAGDRLRPAAVERLQLSLRAPRAGAGVGGGAGYEVESVALGY